MVTIASLGSAAIMLLLAFLLLLYAIINRFVLKREGTKAILRSSLFCALWSAGLALSWVAFVFVL